MIVQTVTVGPVQTNCYVVGCPQTRSAAVIDPGGAADTILQAARSAGLTITVILLTHGHFDHIGAVADVQDATHASIAVHERELDWLYANGGAGAFGYKIRSVPQPDRLLVHGDTIEVGTLTFETRYVPGHTVGHVAFIEQQQRAAFVGDALFAGSIGRTDLPGGDYATLIASITNQLLTLPDDFKVYSGHGPPTTIGLEKRTNPFL